MSNLVNDNFDIQAINSSEIKLLIYLLNNVDYKKIELFDNNTIQIIYNETNLKSDINKDNIESNLKKINNNSDNLDMNTNNISSNLEKINNNSSDISSNLSQISTNKSNISSNLGKINNITKTIMSKNIYFTDFDSNKDEVIVRELLHFDNTTDRFRVATINYVNMEYNFKKDDL